MQIAHARKVRDVAPLACKTDKVDARVLAELCRRDLVPELWVPSLSDRGLRERLRRRTHLVKNGCADSKIFEARSFAIQILRYNRDTINITTR